MGLREEGLANGTVPKRRHQTGLSEQPNFPKLLEVKYYGAFSRRIAHALDVDALLCAGRGWKGIT